jgi:hypothetical protein
VRAKFATAALFAVAPDPLVDADSATTTIFTLIPSPPVLALGSLGIARWADCIRRCALLARRFSTWALLRRCGKLLCLPFRYLQQLVAWLDLQPLLERANRIVQVAELLKSLPFPDIRLQGTEQKGCAFCCELVVFERARLLCSDPRFAGWVAMDKIDIP